MNANATRSSNWRGAVQTMTLILLLVSVATQTNLYEFAGFVFRAITTSDYGSWVSKCMKEFVAEKFNH